MVPEQLDTQRAQVDGRPAPGEGPAGPLEREAELAAARIAVDRLTAGVRPGAPGPGGLVAYTGTAGASKTTVLAEVRALAVERGCTALHARGAEQERATAFHVVRQLLQPLLAGFSERERHDVLGDWYGIIGPCLGLCPREGAPPDPQGVRDGLDWLLTQLAVRNGPLLLTVDDLHWADPESLCWLDSFALRVAELPMLLVVGYRPDELPETVRALAAGRDGGPVRAHELAPLTPAAVANLIRRRFDGHAADEFCHEAWLATGGNPFRAVELAATLRDRGLLPTAENAGRLRDLADSLSGVGLVERLDELGSGAVRFAWAVAVLGSEATMELAASMAALSALDAVAARDRLVRARLLCEGTELEFSHPLVANAIYRQVPGAVRVGLHGKAAFELITAGRSPRLAARHLLETHPEGDDWVVRNLRAAAEEYLRAGAPDAARRCLERALREPPAPDEQAAVCYELGSPALMHDPSTAARHLRTAVEESGEDETLRQDAAIRLARALSYDDRLCDAVAVMEEEAARATDSRVRLRMLAEHFMMAAFAAQDGDARARSRRLTRITERLTGADRTERYLFGLRAWDAMVRGEPAGTALDFAERALADGGMSWTDERWGFEIPTLVALTFLHCDRPETADRLFAEGIGEFERQGWRGVPLALGYTFLGHIRHRTGRLVEAEDFVRAALRLGSRVGAHSPVALSAAGSLIRVLLARGRIEAATDVAKRYRFHEPFPSGVFPDIQAVRGELLLARGEHEEAVADLVATGHRFDERGVLNPGWCPWLPQLALAHAVGDPAAARERAAEAVRRAERFAAPSVLGHALRVAAEVAEPTDRVELMSRAVAVLEESPAAAECATARVSLGALLRQAGRLEEAADQLYRGVEQAASCGLESVVARARRELAAAGLSPRRLSPGTPVS
ncbi:AAA family ATPase [Streptomyces sp. OF3]|uniref:AAA family ATPase n=1 Tax=Streptomyces alkaliterrae TaxID=2213162 RepID=A0A7W3WPB8_9ACTN|nr:AAA family ATPase [Streptomyces alkaliterrae]MBB1256054.1 AAA family ATPase [Streptomyces alkaliterrae]